ncbi:hypothetical protein GQR58_005887 [Nymphon striatum]|nr:hypothetical protein GQR58_005887 [Nymphon striatum]
MMNSLKGLMPPHLAPNLFVLLVMKNCYRNVLEKYFDFLRSVSPLKINLKFDDVQVATLRNNRSDTSHHMIIASSFVCLSDGSKDRNSFLQVINLLPQTKLMMNAKKINVIPMAENDNDGDMKILRLFEFVLINGFRFLVFTVSFMQLQFVHSSD